MSDIKETKEPENRLINSIEDNSIEDNSIEEIHTNDENKISNGVNIDDNDSKKTNENKYNNYISERKKELILDLLKFIGWKSFNDTQYITFSDIQNKRVENFIISMLDALRTVFKTYNIRSMTRQNKDKRFCLNITRQLLQNIGYTLKMKTYPLIRNNIITSSTKYKIIQKK